ncbi:MAG TPA: response regulator [Anaerolineales bacterium]
MLIEDDETMLSLLNAFLEIEGFDVSNPDLNGNIEGILTDMRQARPDLVLLDVHLNQLNGFDLLLNIRQDSSLKSTRVLMSSGMDLSRECDDQGADGFLLKPYMPEDLIGKIWQTLGNA